MASLAQSAIGSAFGGSVKVYWNTAALEAALKGAFRYAALDWKRQAQARSPSRRVARAMNVRFTGSGLAATVGSGSPLAHLFEEGTGPHMIFPGGAKVERTSRRYNRKTKTLTTKTSVRKRRGGKSVLRFPDGGFASGVKHPGMKAQPFMRPGLPLWPAMYRTRARRAL